MFGSRRDLPAIAAPDTASVMLVDTAAAVRRPDTTRAVRAAIVGMVYRRAAVPGTTSGWIVTQCHGVEGHDPGARTPARCRRCALRPHRWTVESAVRLRGHRRGLRSSSRPCP